MLLPGLAEDPMHSADAQRNTQKFGTERSKDHIKYYLADHVHEN